MLLKPGGEFRVCLYDMCNSLAQSPIHDCGLFVVFGCNESRLVSLKCVFMKYVTLWHKVQFMIVACLREYGVMTAGWLLVSLVCISMVVVLYGTKSNIHM